MVHLKDCGGFLRLWEDKAMTKEKEVLYEDSEHLKEILIKTLKGKKYILDCGHHVTMAHHFGNDITIYNGKELKIVCSQCGY